MREPYFLDEENGVGLHPFIQGLLNELPGAGKTAGDEWSVAKHKLWLSTAESIFKMIYKSEPTGREGLEDLMGPET